MASELRSIDLRTTFPRSPHEKLGGISVLARAIDKARAQLAGTLGEYVYFNCRVNRSLFDILDVNDNSFLEVVRQGGISGLSKDREALATVRESLENLPMVSDEDFLASAQASDIDNAVVSWIHGLKTPSDRSDDLDREIEYRGPSAGVQRAFDRMIRCMMPDRASLRSCIDRIDREEGRGTR